MKQAITLIWNSPYGAVVATLMYRSIIAGVAKYTIDTADGIYQVPLNECTLA